MEKYRFKHATIGEMADRFREVYIINPFLRAKIMKVLHILRTEPNDSVKIFMEAFSAEDVVNVTALYKDDIDWPRLVDDIFSLDKEIYWL